MSDTPCGTVESVCQSPESITSVKTMACALSLGSNIMMEMVADFVSEEDRPMINDEVVDLMSAALMAELNV